MIEETLNVWLNAGAFLAFAGAFTYATLWRYMD